MFTGMAVILDNLAISHAVTSYDGKLVIAPLSDRAIMPDPAFYADCLRASFEELKAAAQQGAKKTPTNRKKPAAKKAPRRKKTSARARPTRKSGTSR